MVSEVLHRKKVETEITENDEDRLNDFSEEKNIPKG